MPRADVAAAYDERSDEYIERFGAVEQSALTDRATIEAWGDLVAGRILDAGCGPGHWSDLLAGDGRREVVGVDASAAFIKSARQHFPGLPFARGDLAALPLAKRSVGGILSWFSIIHTAPEGVPAIMREFARVLTPGGSLLLGFFDTEAGVDAGVAFDHAVTTAYYWSAEALGELLTPHGFVVERAAARQDPGARRVGHLVATLTG
ncbi:class I SAM-dependent methyltransferase [Nocardioides jensenii]|uniref:class I SAM-dependent methyltransferase n=1 Tax=Nocardioides jensenii TaxID=1843 RepID=UPI00082F7891|nr:class I SAM-dependent methyltransferase [Nocardioides jensenii]